MGNFLVILWKYKNIWQKIENEKETKLLYTGTNTKQEEHKKLGTLSHVQWNSNDNILVKLTIYPIPFVHKS